MGKRSAGQGALVMITDNRFGEARIEREFVESRGGRLEVADCVSASDVAAQCRDAEALLVNLARVDGSAIEALLRCRVISRYGVGLDNIEVGAAERRGIAVRNVADYCSQEVAEHALGLILSLARGIPARDRAIREGLWNEASPGRRVAGSTLGILGYGGSARALVAAASGLGFARILVWSRSLSEGPLPLPQQASRNPVAAAASLDEVLAESDWLSIHLALNRETRGLLDAGAIARMKSTAMVINTARGGLIDEDALVAALQEGRLGGAGLDVFAVEPLPQGSPLRSLPDVVLSDHAAYASVESIIELRTRCVANAWEAL
ncbi:MAG: C-terminal binding protein [Rectinemataceae bacterium]